VKKQPLLNGFPVTIIATAKRKIQAAICNQQAIITQDSLSGYAVLFANILPSEFLKSIDPTQRRKRPT
jgi:hypothetical protein